MEHSRPFIEPMPIDLRDHDFDHARSCACAGCLGQQKIKTDDLLLQQSGDGGRTSNVPDTPGGTNTNATIAVGGTVVDRLETVGDTDWFRIELVAGTSIDISLFGSGDTPVSDPFLRLYDAAGNLVAENDDGGAGLNSFLRFVAETGGTYYIEADSYLSRSTGEYTITVSETQPLEVFTYDQIAAQLTSGYWGGTARAFDVGSDGILTYDVSALSADGQYLAQQALALWSDVTGIVFTPVTANAEITFTDDEEGAFASSVRNGTNILSSTVNVSTDWLADYGTALDGYAFQTYIHEIGHALGLGHAGNYNGEASYATGALYSNDAWSTTVMSYFDQRENLYFRDLGFSFAPVTTPMVADIVAITQLYGASTSTRAGATVYGFNSTAARSIYDATAFTRTAYTIVDSGGLDRLDYSGFNLTQRIDLREEMFSNIGGLTGTVSIGRGTVIENAIGGSSTDTIVGNAANNNLYGMSSRDALYGGDGSDVLRGGDGDDILFGEAGDDFLEGAQGEDILHGGTGGDYLNGGADNDQLFGEAGNDRLFGGRGDDRLEGNAGADRLSGEGGNDVLAGGAGNDFLSGGEGRDFFVFSNVGSDHADQIQDMVSGVDRIQLDRSGDFAALGSTGALSASQFHLGSAAADADDRIIYDSSTGEIWFDPDGNGSAAAELFATVAPGTLLAASDFEIIDLSSAAQTGTSVTAADIAWMENGIFV